MMMIRISKPINFIISSSLRTTSIRPRSEAAKFVFRQLSTNVGFDEEQAKIYAAISESHKHEKGPWPVITKKVGSLIDNCDRPKILDLATGPGQPALTLAQTYPNAHVNATDLSDDFISKVKAQVGTLGLTNVEPSVVDLQDLDKFSDNQFDIVTCCYGYMFAEDKVKALSETFRVLKPGGSLIATTWDERDSLRICDEIMTAVLKEKPPPSTLNTMSLSEPGLFRSILLQAGFQGENIQSTQSTYPFDFGVDPEFQYKVGTMSIKDKLDELEAHDVARKTFSSLINRYSFIEADGSRTVPNNTFALTVARKN